MKIASLTNNRKKIVKVLEEATGAGAVYLGAPSFGYSVGSYMVDRSGDITAEEMDQEVIDYLVAKGIIADPGADTSETTISLPMEGCEGRSLKNLVFMLHSKGALLGKAVGKPGFYKVSEELITALEERPKLTTEEFLQTIADASEGSLKGLSFETGKISFHFPYTTEPDRLQAFTQLTELMGRMAKEQVRVSMGKCKETNEKYTFRVWLMRLGMKGDKYKAARRILLHNLKGHNAFRTKDQAEAAKEKNLARRAAEKEAAREMAFVEL